LIHKSVTARLGASGVPVRVAGCAASAREALGLYRAVRPDLFFIDINMPDMDGLALVRRIRDEDPHTRTRFIIISGYDDFKHAQEAIRSGVVDYLKKPISTWEFNATLAEAARAIDEERLSRPPDEAGDSKTAAHQAVPPPERKRDFIREVCAWLRQHYRDDITLAKLADTFYVSAPYLSRRFHEKTGVTIGQYLEDVRLEAARDLLKNTSAPIADIGSSVGYLDSAYFARVFRKKYTQSPSEYRLTATL